MSTKPNTSQITYDTGTNKQDLNNILDTVVPISDYAALRNYSGRATQIRITADGIAGFFKYDPTDTTSTDNGGTIIVAGTKRWKRVPDFYLPAGTGAVPRDVQSKLWESVSVKDFGAKCNAYYSNGTAFFQDAAFTVPATDDTLAVQKAIDHAITKKKGLTVPGPSLITEGLVINKQWDNSVFREYLRFSSNSGGGFVTDKPIKLFTSTLAGFIPSHLVSFECLKFEPANADLAAYVLDADKLFRISFDTCDFARMKAFATTTTSYVQSIYFLNCNGRHWKGKFAYAATGYDVQVIGGLYEQGDGDGFCIYQSRGSKFFTQIEGLNGTALKLARARGVDISLYAEGNKCDIDFRNVEPGDVLGNDTRGVNNHGGYFANTLGSPILWGTAFACVSEGNWGANATYPLHDLQAVSRVQINDVLDGGGGLSNRDAITHRGYCESAYTELHLRTGNNTDFTTSEMVGRYTREGNKVDLYFTCKMTSPGHGADSLYIDYGLPFAKVAGIDGVLGGTVVVGATSTPVYAFAGGFVSTNTNIVPITTEGQVLTIRGHISYVASV